MNGRLLDFSLTLERTMIYPVGDTFFSENRIEEIRPSRPPLFRFCLVVPVRSLNCPAFIGALFLVIDLVPIHV